MVNITDLKKAITASGLKKQNIAQVLNISTDSLRNKLNGKTSFNVDEASTLATILNLDRRTFFAIFFGNNVECGSHFKGNA